MRKLFKDHSFNWNDLKKADYLKGVEDLHNKQGSQLKRIYHH